MTQTFKSLAIGEVFKFAWSGYVGTKVSSRCYLWNGHRLQVGTVSVEVISFDATKDSAMPTVAYRSTLGRAR